MNLQMTSENNIQLGLGWKKLGDFVADHKNLQ